MWVENPIESKNSQHNWQDTFKTNLLKWKTPNLNLLIETHVLPKMFLC